MKPGDLFNKIKSKLEKSKADKKLDKKMGVKEGSKADIKSDKKGMNKMALKKTGKFQGKSNKLGGGGRFKQLVAQGKSPALAAYIGRKSLGKAKFQKLAVKGRERANKA